MAIDYSAFSRDQNTAMSQFKAQYGRSPTSAEISGWQAYKSPSASSPSVSLPATPSSNVQQGYGGQTPWATIQNLSAAPTAIAGTEGFSTASNDTLDSLAAGVGRQTASIEDSIKRMADANVSALKGEIPADLSAAVRRAASESSIKGGVFGSASRAMSARDLGRTSYDVQQQGMQNETKINELRGNLATSIQGFRDTLATRNLQIRELENQSRELNLKGIDVERQRIATNIEANVSILGYMSDLIRTQQTLNVEAAKSETDSSGMMGAIDNWLKQFSGKLSG